MGSLLRLRGILLNPHNACPACRGETMRGPVPLLLQPLAWLLGGRVTYRWCRRCLRGWVALRASAREPEAARWRIRLLDPATAAAMRQRIDGMVRQLEAGRIAELRAELAAERWLENLDWSGVPRQLQVDSRASFVEVLVALADDPPDRELALRQLRTAQARFLDSVPG